MLSDGLPILHATICTCSVMVAWIPVLSGAHYIAATDMQLQYCWRRNHSDFVTTNVQTNWWKEWPTTEHKLDYLIISKSNKSKELEGLLTYLGELSDNITVVYVHVLAKTWKVSPTNAMTRPFLAYLDVPLR